MSSRKVPLVFTFRRHGTHPPLYVAGSFSNPPWQPFEMDASIDQHGDLIFTKKVMVDESSEVHYKFRHGSGDWWALDPDAETVPDEHGNLNSLMISPSKYAAEETTLHKDADSSKTQDETAAKASLNDPTAETDAMEINPFEAPADEDIPRRLSFTPIDEVANTAAEVADSASHLGDDDLDIDNSDSLPAFSHECFASVPESPTYSYQRPNPDYDELEPASENPDQMDMDYDDPQLEQFPSDRDSIMATMRRLSTTIEPDCTMVNEVPLSPITRARPSNANVPFSFSPLEIDETTSIPNQSGIAGQYSMSNIARKHSLQSIDEGEEIMSGAKTPEDTEAPDTSIKHIGPVRIRNLSLASSAGIEDEGIDMASVSPKYRTTTIRPEEPPSHDAIFATSADTIGNTKQDDNLSHEDSGDSALNLMTTSPSNDRTSSLQESADGERPYSSLIDSINGSKESYLLLPLLRTIVIDWIGGTVYRLFCQGRNQLARFQRMTGTGALLALGAGVSLWALQDRLPSMSLSGSSESQS